MFDDIDLDTAETIVDEYAKRVHGAETIEQENTIRVGHALSVLYNDDGWLSYMDEHYPIKQTKRQGRPVDPHSQERFAKYNEAKRKLSRQRVNQLLAANSIVTNYCNSVAKTPETEGSIRPLKPLVKEGRADDIPKVWESAVDKAEADGRETPTVAHVKAAISEYRATLPKGNTTGAKSTPGELRTSRALGDLVWLVGNGHRDAVRQVWDKLRSWYPGVLNGE